MFNTTSLNPTEFNVRNKELNLDYKQVSDLTPKTSGIKVAKTFIDVNKGLINQNLKLLKDTQSNSKILDQRHLLLTEELSSLSDDTSDNFDIVNTALLKGKIGNKKLQSTILLESITKSLLKLEKQLYNQNRNGIGDFFDGGASGDSKSKSRTRGKGKGRLPTKLPQGKDITIGKDSIRVRPQSRDSTRLKTQTKLPKGKDITIDKDITKLKPQTKLLKDNDRIKLSPQSSTKPIPKSQFSPDVDDLSVGKKGIGGFGRTLGRVAAPLAVGLTAYDLYSSYKEGDMRGVAQAAGGGLGGVIGGAATGAAIGSIVPGVGTAVGGIVGGGLGYLAGTELGGTIYDWWNKDEKKPKEKSTGHNSQFLQNVTTPYTPYTQNLLGNTLTPPVLPSQQPISVNKKNEITDKLINSNKESTAMLNSNTQLVNSELIKSNKNLANIQKDIEKIREKEESPIPSVGVLGAVASSWLAVQAFLGIDTKDEMKQTDKLSKEPVNAKAGSTEPSGLSALFKDLRSTFSRKEEIKPTKEKAKKQINTKSNSPNIVNSANKSVKNTQVTPSKALQKSATANFSSPSPIIDPSIASSLSKYAKVGSVDVSGLQTDFKNRFGSAARDYYEATGRKVPITSAFRSQKKQAELWVRANKFHEPGIFTPALPADTTKVTWKGQEFTVPGSGRGSLHMKGLAIDVSRSDAASFEPYANRYGLGRPHMPKDPPHFEITDGSKPIGSFDGTSMAESKEGTSSGGTDKPSDIPAISNSSPSAPLMADSQVLGTDTQASGSPGTSSGASSAGAGVAGPIEVASNEVNLSKSVGVGASNTTIPIIPKDNTPKASTTVPKLKLNTTVKPPKRTPPTLLAGSSDGGLDLPSYVDDPAVQAFRQDPNRPIEG